MWSFFSVDLGAKLECGLEPSTMVVKDILRLFWSFMLLIVPMVPFSHSGVCFCHIAMDIKFYSWIEFKSKIIFIRPFASYLYFLSTLSSLSFLYYHSLLLPTSLPHSPILLSSPTGLSPHIPLQSLFCRFLLFFCFLFNMFFSSSSLFYFSASQSFMSK